MRFFILASISMTAGAILLTRLSLERTVSGNFNIISLILFGITRFLIWHLP